MGDFLSANCDINPAAVVGRIPDPVAFPTFFNPDWTAPTSDPESGWSLEILYNDAWWEFGWYLIGKSVKINTRNGEPGTVEFTIVTGTKNVQEVPFVPVGNMKFRLRNYSQNKWYASGYTRHPRPEVRSRNDTTYKEKQHITYLCTDSYHALEYVKDIIAVYEGQTTFFILRDVIRKYAKSIDYTQIDATKGQVVPEFKIELESPAEILQRVLDIEQTLTYRIDPETDALIIKEKTDADFISPITVTDATLYNYFSLDFDIHYDWDHVKTDVHLIFTEKHSEGTVNVANASPTIVGFTGTENWYHIDARNAKFRLLSSTKYYSIAENLSDPVGPVLDMTLSGDYEEATQTNQPYEIIGQRRRVVATNEELKEYLRTYYGGDGVRQDVIAVENSSPLTYYQALFMVQTYRNLFSQPFVSGYGRTSNRKFPLDKHWIAGDSLTLNLTNSKQFDGIVVLEDVTATCVGGKRRGADGNIYPIIEYEFDFSKNIMKAENQIKKLMMQGRKVTSEEISTIPISAYVALGQTVYVKDCIKARSPLVLEEEIEVSDTIIARDLSGASGHVTSPTSGTPAFTLGPTKVSLTA